jgi:aquaporin Z
MKSLRNKADVAQWPRMAQRQLSTNFLNHALEWRRIFAEAWGTFLLVVVAAGGAVVAARAAGPQRRTCWRLRPGLW